MLTHASRQLPSWLIFDVSRRTSFRHMSETPKTEANDAPKTYSIALRLRRVIYEDAYVRVPVTAAVIEERKDGTRGINFDALVAEGIRIGGDKRTEWKFESSTSECHPLQQAPPEDRLRFCPLFDEPLKHSKG